LVKRREEKGRASHVGDKDLLNTKEKSIQPYSEETVKKEKFLNSSQAGVSEEREGE